MSSLTLEIPDELAERLSGLTEQLPRILDLGLRALSAEAQRQYAGPADFLEIRAGLPAPDEVLALRASHALQERISAFLEKNRTARLSLDVRPPAKPIGRVARKAEQLLFQYTPRGPSVRHRSRPARAGGARRFRATE